jgi:UDP-glucose 4-epimerase
VKTYLVTGGCGFIGSHLCSALLTQGHAARVLDDLSTGSLANLPRGAEFIQGDILDGDLVRTALDGVDGCFHLAAISSVQRGTSDWLTTHRVNLGGTVTLFDAIRTQSHTARTPVVYASSAAVYGDCKDLPITESAEKSPLSAYAADKYGCELHARVAEGVHGIPTVGLRFFNVYGPNQDPGSPYSGVIAVFADRLQRHAPVDIFGDGEQTRDFVYVGDAVTALLHAMELQPSGAPVYNVCTGTPTSIRELARIIGEVIGSDPVICYRAVRAAEIRHSLGSRARAKTALSLPEPTRLRAGLAALLAGSNVMVT